MPSSSPRPLDVHFAVMDADTDMTDHGNRNGDIHIISGDSSIHNTPNHGDGTDSETDSSGEAAVVKDDAHADVDVDVDESTGDEGYDFEGSNIDSSNISIEYFDDSGDDDDHDHDVIDQEMIQFFHMIAQIENPHVYSDDDEDEDEDYYDDDEDDDEDDLDDSEDDDEDYEDCDSYQNDDDDDEDGDSDPCTCPHCLMDRIIGCKDCWDDGSVGSDNDGEDNSDDENDNDELPLDPNASPCAICMEPETAKRRFVHLPCCGTTRTAMERDAVSGLHILPVDTSSTRFCQTCLARYLVTNGCAVPCNLGKNNNNVTNNNTRAIAQLAGECPRCKKILVLEDYNNTDTDAPGAAADASSVLLRMSCPNNECKHNPSYRHTFVTTPSTEALFWYVARYHKGSGRMVDTEYRAFLLTLAAYPNPYCIPEELLLNNSGSPENIRNLCQWGLLYRRNNNNNTTRGRLQQQLKTLYRRILHALLEHPLWKNNINIIIIRNRLWKGMTSVFGPRLGSARSNVHNWKVSQIIRSASDTFHKLPNRAGTIYGIDPLVQSELRSLVLRHLQCSVNGGDGLDRDNDCDHDHHEYYYQQQHENNNNNEDCSLRLLPPLLRAPAEAESNEIVNFCEQNGRHQSFLVAWNCFASAWMAICRFRLFRSLQLIDHGLSLALLSTKHLGLPPITEWHVQIVAPVVATSSEPTIPKGRHSTWRWRWHVMSGLNVILVVLALKILVQLVCIGMHLILAASACLLVGKFLESLEGEGSRSQSQPGASKEASSSGEEEKDDDTALLLKDKRIVSGVVALLYAAWHTFALLCAAIEVVRT